MIRVKLQELLGTIITEKETLRDILLQRDKFGRFDKKLMMEIIILLVEEMESLEADSI